MSRLQRRLQELIDIRKKIMPQVVKAREMGDLSENAEYKAAREAQRNIENEYNRIKSRLTKLQVLDPEKIPKDAVRFGARVSIENLEDGKISLLQLVGIDEIFETDGPYERISIASPLGKNMIGKKTEEVFKVEAPIGDRYFKILEIK